MVACGAPNDIVGKWYFEADGGNGEYVQFNEDETVTYSDNSNVDTYTVDGSALKIFNADGVQSDSGLTIDGDEIKFDNGSTILYKVDNPPESVSISEIVLSLIHICCSRLRTSIFNALYCSSFLRIVIT